MATGPGERTRNGGSSPPIPPGQAHGLVDGRPFNRSTLQPRAATKNPRQQ